MKNAGRIIRSATFEGMADEFGNPTREYVELYENLAINGIKHIIMGFMFISTEGRAMHKGQAGMNAPEKVEKFKPVTNAVHNHGRKIYAQIAHTGRQTTNTGCDIVGVSSKKSAYFNETPRTLTTTECYEIAKQFANSALFAKQAECDGIQIHAAHGYLIHQFMTKKINNRKDTFAEPFRFLETVIENIRNKCGDLPIWIKVSGNADDFAGLIKFLDRMKVDLIEVSYGTMDYALNIFRGSVPLKIILKHNPLINKWNWLKFALKLKKYTPMYNLKYAELAKRHTNIPISVVGGFRTAKEVENCKIDYVSLCRPFICEPDLLQKEDWKSSCVNCNACAVMVDSKNNKLRCYNGRKSN